MRRRVIILLAPLTLLLGALPGVEAQYGRYGGAGPRDAQRTVARWYQRYLRRDMDPYSGSWVQALQQGQEPEQVLSGILGSDEYFQNAGGTPAAFVRRLYEDVTGRRPTPREEDTWVRQVYHRARSDVAYAVLTRNAQNWDDDHDAWRDRHDYRRPYNPYR